MDNETLSNQRFDNHILMRALLVSPDDMLEDDPLLLMWHGYEKALLAYHQAICNEWTTNRGFKDPWWDKTRKLFLSLHSEPISLPMILPPWLGDADFHISHQSELLRRDEKHYRTWFPGIEIDHICIWPVV